MFPKTYEVMVQEIGHKFEAINDGSVFLTACDFIMKELIDPSKVYNKDGEPI